MRPGTANDPSVVLVTGAAGGIGAAIAEAFAAAGGTVRLLDRDIDGASAQAAALRDRGLVAEAGWVDVTESASVDAAVAEALADHGRIDTLCNNAGIADGLKTVDEVDEEAWDQIFAVNVKGLFLATRAVLPGMRARGRGAIVNIASVAGFVGAVSGAAYTASKHAVIGLTRNIAASYGRDGIRCNAICPGGIDSGMPLGDITDPILAERVSRIRSTMPRRGSPAEIAGLATFLASDAASFVNGAVIVADGGWTTSPV
jgi:NAD(P)-dependent dehydrogenase (short-subunit alcohol dehydrogenase family)